jgi:hypothetical protein
VLGELHTSTRHNDSSKRQTHRSLSIPHSRPAAHWMRERASYRRRRHRHTRSPVHSIDVAMGSNGHMMGSAREGRGVQPAAGSSGDGGTRSGNGGRRCRRGDEGRSCQSLSKHARHFCCCCLVVVRNSRRLAVAPKGLRPVGSHGHSSSSSRAGAREQRGQRRMRCEQERKCQPCSDMLVARIRCAAVPSRAGDLNPPQPRSPAPCPAEVDTPHRRASSTTQQLAHAMTLTAHSYIGT